MRIAILGSGGVGGYFGGRLAAAGVDVSFIARGAHLAALRAGGLRIESPLGNVHVPRVHATDDPAAIGPVDLVLFTVKLYDTDEAVKLLPRLIGRHTIVVPLQNGVDSIGVLTRAVGAEHVAGGTTYVVSVVAGPGVIRHGALGRLIFGPVSGPPPAILSELRDVALGAGIEALLSEKIIVDIWSKFVRLSVFSGMTAVTRCPLGPLMKDPDLRAMMHAAWEESAAVAAAKGIALSPTIVQDIEKNIDAMPPHSKSSMLEDLERGHRLELPWLSGAIVRIAEEVGVDVPTHKMIATLLGPHVNGTKADVTPEQ